jgi:hypothetical protein
MGTELNNIAGTTKITTENDSATPLGVVASGTNTYAATISPAITAYATNQTYAIRFTNANTGASTLNLNGLGAKTIQRNGSIALRSGDIQANQAFWLMYDGTNFQIVGRISTDWSPNSIPLAAILTIGSSFIVNGTGIGTGVILSMSGSADDRFFFNDNLNKSNNAYDGSDLALIMHGRLSANGGVGDNLKFNVNYAFVKDGDNSQTASTSIAEQTVDVSSELQDIDFEIELGTMTGVVGADTVLITVERNASGAGQDTFSGQWEIISLQWRIK